ncbi:MAG: class I SAM-dependent methyltransferase [Steroidobacterales bacterium]
MGHSQTHWDAHQYSANSAVQYRIAMAVLAEHTFSGDEAVLDVGCGDGKITHEIALRVPKGRVLGIDSSESMIRFAQETRAAQANLSFALKDVTNLPYANEFDVAVSTFCLQWVPDKLKAFRAVKNSLRPGGKMILLMPFRNPEIASLRKEMTREASWKHYFVDYVDPSDCADDVQYESYAERSGFTINSYLIDATSADFGSVAAFADFVGAVTPHLDRLPGEDEKRAFMEELVRRYLEITPPARQKAYAATYVYVCAKMVATAA